MAMYQCEVVTNWVIADNGDRLMGVAVAYPAEWSDVTEQPDANLMPDPNAFVAHGQKLTTTQADALLADANFTVLWIEEVA